MKTLYLKAIVLLGIASLLSGCYTQVASGYDDYYGERKERYQSSRPSSEYEESSAVSGDTEQSEENYTSSENYESDSYCFGGGYFPHYRRYFWHYHPSYSFSVCMGYPYPPRWWDPWFGWYNPCFPTGFYEPYWYWYDYSPWYWIHPVTTVYYAQSDYGYRYRDRDKSRIRDIGGRTPINGRDLTRLGNIQTRQRNENTLTRFRGDKDIAASRNPFILRDRAGRNGGITTSREGIGRGINSGVVRGGRSGVSVDANRRADRNADRNSDINTRLRAREKDSRNDVFKQDRSRRSSLGDLDPAYRNDKTGRSADRQTDRSRVDRNNTDRRESVSPNRSGDRKSGQQQTDRRSSSGSRDQKKQDTRSYSPPSRNSSPSYSPPRHQAPSYSPAPRSSGSAPSAPRSSGGGSAPRSSSRERR